MSKGLKQYTSGATTIEEVQKRLAEVKAAFPDNSYFTTDGKKCKHEEFRTTCWKDDHACDLKRVMGTLGYDTRYDPAISKQTLDGYNFIRFVYFYLFNSLYYDATVSRIEKYPGNTFSMIFVNECSVKDIASNALPGDVVTFRDYEHPYVYAGENNGIMHLFCVTTGNCVRYTDTEIAKNSGTVKIFRNKDYGEAVAKSAAPPEPVKPAKDKKPPVIRDVRIENITENGYDVSCIATDNNAVKTVTVQVWHSDSDEETEETARYKMHWTEAVLQNGRYTYHVNRADHDNKYGMYHTHLFAEDLAGNVSDVVADTVSVGTLAQEWETAFKIEVTKLSPVGFNYMAGYAQSIPEDEVLKMRVVQEFWSEEKGKEYQQGADTDAYAHKFSIISEAGFYGGATPIKYVGISTGGYIADKMYGFSKTYHIKISAAFSDGSQINRSEIVELPDSEDAVVEETWNGHIYKLYWGNYTWEEAEAICENQGGHLVTITSNEENEFLAGAFDDRENVKYGFINSSNVAGNPVGRDWYFTGGVFDTASGKTKWVTGEESEFSDWKKDIPNDNSENGVIVLGNTGRFGGTSFYGEWKWDELPADSRKCGFICEIDGLSVSGNKAKLNKDNVELKVGESSELAVELFASGESKDLVLEPADTNVVTAEGNVLKAIGVGETDVNVIELGSGFSAVCHVKVDKIPVSEVTLDKSALELKIGESASLVAGIKPENATEKGMKWSSDNEAVAIVDQSGKVDAKARGKATITVQAADAPEKSAKCVVTVKDENVIAEEEKTVTTLPVQVNDGTKDGKEIVLSSNTIYNNAIVYTGKKIEPGEMLDAHTAVNIKIEGVARNDTSKYITVSYVAKNNVNAFVAGADGYSMRKQPYFYPKLKFSKKAAGEAGLSAQEIKVIKRMVARTNKKLKGERYTFTINPYILTDTGVQLKAKAGKSGDMQTDKNGRLKAIKSVKYRDTEGNWKKLNKKDYEIISTNKELKTAVLQGKRNMTGRITVKIELQ